MYGKLLIFLLAATSFGCASREPERPLRAPPPAPLPEIRSGAETAGLVWAPGYWHWDGAGYVWVPGHWESPPALVSGKSSRLYRIE